MLVTQPVDTSAPDDRSSKAEDYTLSISTVGGEEIALTLESSSTIEEAKQAVEEEVGIPAFSQSWLLDDEIFDVHSNARLQDTPLRDGARITVVRLSIPLKPLPEAFRISLTSVRYDLHKSFCSSGFSVVLHITGSVSAGILKVEPWRKNDHDVIEFNSKTDTHVVETSHWMTGNSRHSLSLNGRDPLGELMGAWHPRCAIRVDSKTERFWRMPGEVQEGANECGRDEAASKSWSRERSRRCIEDPDPRPEYDSCDGWFTAPSEECVELKVNVPLYETASDKVRITRLLVEPGGKLLRAAVTGFKGLPDKHPMLEEYVVDHDDVAT